MTNTTALINNLPNDSVTLSEESINAILAQLSRNECLFAAYWQDPQGVIPTTKVAEFFKIDLENVLYLLENHYQEFESELQKDGNGDFLWNPRAIIHIGMLLNCAIATDLRALALDVIEAHKNRDKRAAVAFLLQKAEFAQWSDRLIAKILECSDKTVGRTRKELEEAGKIVKFERRSFSRGGKIIEQSSTKESTLQPSSATFPQMHPSNTDSTVEDIGGVERDDTRQPIPKSYSEEEVQKLIAIATNEIKQGIMSELREQAEKNVKEQLAAAQAIANQRAKEVAALHQKIEELEGLRRLESENQQLQQRIKDLEKAIDRAEEAGWGNTFNKQATKAINKEALKALEQVDTELDLRVLATTPPPRNRYREVRQLFEKAADMLERVPLAGRRCFFQGRYGTIADVNDETCLAEVDWDTAKEDDSADDRYPLDEIMVLPTIEGIAKGSWVSWSYPGEKAYGYKGEVKEIHPLTGEATVYWTNVNKLNKHPIAALRIIRVNQQTMSVA